MRTSSLVRTNETERTMALPPPETRIIMPLRPVSSGHGANRGWVMLYMEAVFPRLNAKLSGDVIGDVSVEVVAGEPTLVEVLSRLEVPLDPAQEIFTSQVPSSMQAALVAVLRDNLQREPESRKQMMVSWAP